jgi:predicted CopG family antitoxin
MKQLNETQKVKTIVISENTYLKLNGLGSMGMSFDDVIIGILEQVKEKVSESVSK